MKRKHHWRTFLPNNIYIFDNILPDNVHNFFYDTITSDRIWHLNTVSKKDATKIAGSTLYDVNEKFDDSRSYSLALVLFEFIKTRCDFLPSNIKRIHLGAKAANQDDQIHIDDSDENAYTILYYLNKEWNSEWGGQTIVGNKEVDYVPNRAVVYKSNVRHGGKSGTGSLFRTYINYVVTK